MDILPSEQNDVYISLFTAALFITAADGKQTQSSSLGDWLNKFWDRPTMGYCTVVKKMEAPLCVLIQKEFQARLLSEKQSKV